ELDVLYYLVPALLVTRGSVAPELSVTIDRAVELATRLRADAALAPALASRQLSRMFRGDYAAVEAAAAATLAEMDRIGNPVTILQTRLIDAIVHMYRGRLAAAHDALARVRDTLAAMTRPRVVYRMEPV